MPQCPPQIVLLPQVPLLCSAAPVAALSPALHFRSTPCFLFAPSPAQTGSINSPLPSSPVSRPHLFIQILSTRRRRVRRRRVQRRRRLAPPVADDVIVALVSVLLLVGGGAPRWRGAGARDRRQRPLVVTPAVKINTT